MSAQLILLIFVSCIFIIFILMSVYWIIVLLKRIYCFRRYQRGLAKLITNVESDYINEQYYYHYETCKRLSVYLILMNLAEISFGFAYLFELVLEYYYKSTGMYKLYWNRLDQCLNVNNTLLLEFQTLDFSILYITTFSAIGDTMGIYLSVVAICLMNYLTKRISQVKELSGRVNSRNLLIITSIISMVQIASAYFTTFINVGKLILLASQIPYYIILVKTANQYKSTLLQKAIQRLTQYGSNRDELK